MEDKLQSLLDKIRNLEQELLQEIQKKEEEFLYEIREKKVIFEREIRVRHKLLLKRMHRYLYDAKLLNILTAPIIWACLVPAVLMDLSLTVFQSICFPVYGIPKVKRSDYIVLDRQYLSYLNPIEKLNCFYCGYFNGMASYIKEIGARTEQYWCPIKHARKLKTVHSRYDKFSHYGDAESYRGKLDEIRKDFDDIKDGTPGAR
ncbi:MAG: hypothetical protein ACQ9MH_04390 [Nitrospinales bacterium]